MRAAEMHDALNRHLYHPLAARLARLLLPTGVSPNAVSVAGMLAIWAAAWCYANLAWPGGALLGFGLLLLWHILDGTDGDLARLSGKASATGELVDGLCDHVGQIVLYLVLASILDDQLGGWAWALAVAAGASHIVQSNHAESQRRSYLWWAYGVPWLKQAQQGDDEVFRKRGWFSRAFAWGARDYLKVAKLMAPYAARLDAVVDQASGDPAQLDRIRDKVRRAWRRSLVLERMLGANPRTIILGISMLAGSPLWFFLVEILLHNALLVISVWHHGAVGRRLVQELG